MMTLKLRNLSQMIVKFDFAAKMPVLTQQSRQAKQILLWPDRLTGNLVTAAGSVLKSYNKYPFASILAATVLSSRSRSLVDIVDWRSLLAQNVASSKGSIRHFNVRRLVVNHHRSESMALI